MTVEGGVVKWNRHKGAAHSVVFAFKDDDVGLISQLLWKTTPQKILTSLLSAVGWCLYILMRAACCIFLQSWPVQSSPS